MKQRSLFPPPLITCETCGWSWREGDPAPAPHRACTDQEVPRLDVPVEDPLPEPTARRRPLKKWRCSRCWKRFGRPREERHPVCSECAEGDATLFGPREILVPEEARPIRPRRRRTG